MPDPILTQPDMDAALDDFNSALASAAAPAEAMYTVQFPATSYTDATEQATAIKAAGDARDKIAATLDSASESAAQVAAQIKLLLPLT